MVRSSEATNRPTICRIGGSIWCACRRPRCHTFGSIDIRFVSALRLVNANGLIHAYSIFDAARQLD